MRGIDVTAPVYLRRYSQKYPSRDGLSKIKERLVENL